MGRVKLRFPIDPFRDRYVYLRQTGQITAVHVAREMGWYRKPPPSSNWKQRTRVPDIGHVNRALGLRPSPKRGGQGTAIRREVRYDTAIRLAEVLGMDPWELGL